LVKLWLNTCLVEYDRCKTLSNVINDGRSRPTIVLELTDNKPRLKCNIQDINPLQYMTLGHMWGAHPFRQLRLVRSKLTQFQSKVPYCQLSFIYKETIRVTRLLGYEYLSIDALCIIQDCIEDWTTEASKMAGIYCNSICN
jgi:hypothetical protein